MKKLHALALSSSITSCIALFAGLPSPTMANNLETLDLLLDMGLNKKSLILATKLSRNSPNDAQTLSFLARAHYQSGNLDQAEKIISRALELDGNHSNLLNTHGLVLARKSKMNYAIRQFTKSIKMDRLNYKALSNRGIAKGAIKDFSGAIKDFNAAIIINPRHANSYRNRGISKEAIQDMEGACSDWKIAKSLGQDDPGKWHSEQCLGKKNLP